MPRVSHFTHRAKYLLVSALMLAGVVFSYLNASNRQLSSILAESVNPASSSVQVNEKSLTGEEAADSTPQDSVSGALDVAQVGEAYGKLPLSFEANAGQADESVKFLARGPGYGLFLTANEAVLTLKKSSDKTEQQAVVRMKLLGANAEPHVAGQDELPGKSNYFIGNDPAKWRTGVANYAKVQYRDVYPGVDMVYYGNQRTLEYDFIVAPGVNPQTIALGFEGVDKLEVNDAGDLVLRTQGGEIRQQKPFVYQEVEGARREVAAGYVLKGEREVAFAVGEYDNARPLVIDPLLHYSTYLGGINSDSGYGIAADAAGNAYITGTTASDNFPVSATAKQKTRTVYPGRPAALYSDAFVTKLNAPGTAIVYSTYLGGGIAGEIGKGIAIDGSGNAYVTGVTGGGNVLAAKTNDFPLVNASQTKFGGIDDTFVTKLNATGSAILFSTYLGGVGSDSGEKIAVNATSDAYVTGSASVNTFPTTPGTYKQSTCAGCATQPTHAFVAKFDTTGTVEWSTLVGAGVAYDIAVDASGNSYITGAASHNTGAAANNHFPVTEGAYQPVSGGLDAFVTKLNPFGSDLIYSTYLGGGPKADRGSGISIDAAGNAYVTGQTQSSVFPTTPGAFDITFNGIEDAFVTKLNSTGTDILYSTFIGGTTQDIGRSIAVDKSGNAYITGQTKSINFPTKNTIQPRTLGTEVFLTKLNPTGAALVYSTFLGTGDGRDVVVDASGTAYLTGQATQIPVTTNAFQTTRNTGNNIVNHDAFVMRVRSINETTPTFSIGGKIIDTSNNGFPSEGIVTLTLTGAQNRTTNLTLSNTYSFGALGSGTYTVTPSKPGFKFEPESLTFNTLSANQVADFTVVANDTPSASVTSPTSGASFAAPASITITANAADTDGTVSEVQFYANTQAGTTVIIGTDTTAPYSVTWKNVAGGHYVLGAIAKDNQGATGETGEPVAIYVSSIVPATVTMISPFNEASYKTSEYFAVSASVTSGGTDIDYMDFFAGTTHIGRDTTAPYSIQWRSTTAGIFSLTAKAIDLGNAVGTSSPVTVTIHDTITTLLGQITDGTTPLAGVTVQLTGTRTATVTTGADGKYSFPNLPAEGGYTVTPTKAGYTFEPASFSTDFLGYYDRTENFRAIRNSPVTVRVTSPLWGAQFYAPTNITIDALASSTAGTISKVDFYANTPTGQVFIGTDTTSPHSIVWNNAPAGDHYVFAIATDSSGATKTSEANPITVHPAPTIVSINGQITDGDGTGMAGLKLTLSGTKTGTAITNSGGYYVFYNLPVGGNYTVTPPASYAFTPPSRTFNNLTADELDADFNTTAFNTSPTIALTSPVNNATFTAPSNVSLSATASDKDGTVTRVQFYVGNILVGTDSVAPYGFVWSASTAGTYRIVAIATDNGGYRTTSAAVTITVKAGTTAFLGSDAAQGDAFTAMLTGEEQSEALIAGLEGKKFFADLFSMSGYSLAPFTLDAAVSTKISPVARANENNLARLVAIPHLDLALTGSDKL